MLKVYKFQDLVIKTRKVRGIKTNEYKNAGEYPVIDQGKDFITGYSDNENALYKDTLPVVIFGDHTLAVKFVDFPFCAGADGTQILKPNEKIVIGKFLYYAILNLNIKSLGYSRHFKVLKESTFHIPSLEDQKRVVKILDQADSLRQKRKQAIKLLGNYLQSVFLEMFGDPIKNLKGWEIRRLGEVCDVRDGTHDSPKYKADGFPLITSKNIKNDSIDFSEVNLISEKDFISINKRSLVGDGDILMPMIGTIGNPIIVKKDRDFAIKNVALIKFNKDTVNNTYIKNLLGGYFLDNYISKKSRGGTQKFLSLSDIRNIEIPVPDIDTQKKFSKLVLEVESLRQKMLFQLEELEMQFQALMQKAFKGEL